MCVPAGLEGGGGVPDPYGERGASPPPQITLADKVSIGYSASRMTPEQFQRLRHSIGLTQAEAAERLGVTRLAVARYETGTRKISEPVARLWTRLAAEEKAKGKRGRGRR